MRKKLCVLPYLGHMCDCENFFPKKVSIDPFWNPKSTKIILITAFVDEKNAKYSTKCESLPILKFDLLIWNSPEAASYDYLMLFEYIMSYAPIHAPNNRYFQKRK